MIKNNFCLLKRSFLCTVSVQTHQKPSAFEIFSHVIRWSSVTTIKHLLSCILRENLAPETVTSWSKLLNASSLVLLKVVSCLQQFHYLHKTSRQIFHLIFCKHLDRTGANLMPASMLAGYLINY